MKSGSEPLLWFHALNLKINIGWLYGFFILFMLVGTSNAVNLTDGVDGLAGSVSAIMVTALSVIALKVGNPAISIFGAIVVGCCAGCSRKAASNISPVRINEVQTAGGTDWVELIVFEGTHEFCKFDEPIEKLISDLHKN